ncbi:efflux RND transporter periplasmic adaptor subunit [Pleurocapsales cyanobacterium LEGE 10410]|nr:efflux RND transporter periplasmic adaptor subunit [Pleurocapsales cyanobacterium LEGE 10410]
MSQQIANKGRIAVSLATLASFVPGLAALYFWRLQANPPQANNPPAAQPAPEVPVVRNVTSLGRIEPRGEVITVSGTSGSRISELLVSEGQQVQQGEILAYLEDYDEKLAEKNLAASQLAEAQVRYDSSTKFGEAQIKEAETRIAQIESPQSYEVEAQKARVKQLTAELNTTRKDYQRNQFLVDEGAVSQQVLDENAVNFYSKEAELDNAKAELAQLTEARTQNLANARAQLESARAELAQTQSEIEVQSAQSNLELAEASLERTIVRAPRPGQVLDIAAYSGEVVGDDGILQLGDIEQMYVVAEVYESDIQEIELGQTAIVTDPSLPRAITGTVERVSSQIGRNDILDNDPAADTDSRVIEVKIRLNEEDSSLVAGLINLQVDVEIESGDVSLTP